MREERKHIGPYQRPAPPKRPLGLGASKAIQKPAVPMHEIQEQQQRLLDDIKASGNVLGLTAKVRKPGRPSVHEQPMTPAERQARRRELQARDKAIRDTRNIGVGHGKSRLEAASGGYGSTKLDMLEAMCTDDGTMTKGWRRVSPKPAGDECGSNDDSEASSHKVQVRGLQFGDEKSNHRRFAEDELKKMVGEYFALPGAVKTPSAHWVSRHVSNGTVQPQCSQLLTLSCKVCGDVMESIDDATDHLRVDHRKAIDEWFRRLVPSREFRDMGDFITVVMPRRSKKSLN
jgi:hypothetical protein